MIASWGWQRISLASLVSAAACSFALGGLASVCLSQRFLTQFITANSNDGTFAINGSAAFDWEDGLCAHIVAYVGAFLVACCAVLFAFLMRDPAQAAPPSKHGIAAIIMPFGATVFGIAALGGGIIDRTMTKQLFDPQLCHRLARARTVLRLRCTPSTGYARTHSRAHAGLARLGAVVAQHRRTPASSINGTTPWG